MTGPVHEQCGAGCGAVVYDRSRYYTGKYMTARDFAADPAYLLSRHRLHNRLLHGWGIVCGLEVDPHPREECKDRWVVVRPGVALDCCGRELVRDRAAGTAFELPLPGGGTADEDARDEPFLLALRYREDEVEHTPVLYDEGACAGSRTEPNRVRESAELVAIDWDPACWPVPLQGGEEIPCHDDCDDGAGGPGGSCLEPDCPCGEVVPLALVVPEQTKGGRWRFRLDDGGRRRLPPPASALTHVVRTNWEHGGTLTLAELRENLGGRLEVDFDRQLRPADGDRTGINPFTFTVQYAGLQQGLEFLAYPDGEPPTLEGSCRAVYTIDRRNLRSQGTSVAGSVVYVTLRCDFVLDSRGWPVDGNHLRGRLPSGDGLPGGLFESWFRVEYDDDGKGDYGKGDYGKGEAR